VLNIVNGFGLEAGKPLATSPRIAKIAFTGETTTGRLIMQYASQNLIPGDAGTRRQVAEHLLRRRDGEDDDYLDKALEGFAMFALNQGEVCTCPSRALIQESIYDRFMERRQARRSHQAGQPARHAHTMIGAQASSEQLEKILSYLDIGKQEGAKVLPAARATSSAATWPAATTSSRRSSRATTRCASSRRRSSARWSRSRPSRTRRKRSRSPTTRSTASAPACGAAMRTACYRFGRGIQAGRVWTNCYHAYPRTCGLRRLQAVRHRPRNHKMMLDHYQQTKNMLVSYSPKALGFF
jgi:aldehyde dehydrogenase